MGRMGIDECLSPKFQEVMKTPDYADFKQRIEISENSFLEER